jgi:hypothetical protein
VDIDERAVEIEEDRLEFASQEDSSRRTARDRAPASPSKLVGLRLVKRAKRRAEITSRKRLNGSGSRLASVVNLTLIPVGSYSDFGCANS